MHVVIVGGGIAGLAAAFFLRDGPERVTVLEGSPRLGGKLATSEIAGLAVDEGAEALLVTRPEGTELIAEAGLDLVTPGTTTAAIWTRGAMRSLPRRQFMGVPSDLAELAASGIVSPGGVARAEQDRELPPTERDGDVSVGDYVGARQGHEVVDRLVDPLLGGVYAGLSAELSFDATIPALSAASRRHRSLADAAGSLLPPEPQPAPGSAAGTQAGTQRRVIFSTLAAGLGTLPDVLAKLSGATIRTGAVARELSRTEEGWRLTIGSAAAPEWIDADAVILAVPARPAGRLLAGVPGASAAVAAYADISYASMAIVTVAYRRYDNDIFNGSGYLVPAVDGRGVKAVTFSTIKWPHLVDPADPIDVVRCSIGRVGEEALLQRDDADLVALATAELAAATGVRGAPLASRVTRWGGALPQYTVGHLDRVRRIRETVAALDGIAVCGAAYDGVGIPACIGTARAAVGKIRGDRLEPWRGNRGRVT